MARPKSKDKRSAILTATTELIADQGLGVPTAEIAKRAGVSSGSVFTYFSSKLQLLNELYLELTRELTDTVLATMPAGKDTHAQFLHLWTAWTHWGAAHPEKQRSQVILQLSRQLSEENRATTNTYARPVLQLIRRVSSAGALRNAPLPYVGALVQGWASATIDHMVVMPDKADKLSKLGFESVWRALS